MINSKWFTALMPCQFYEEWSNSLYQKLCLCMALNNFSFAGGKLANSLAIMTDAAHMLSDFASFLISLFALWMANRPATQKMSFGYYRAGEFIHICCKRPVYICVVNLEQLNC